MLHAVIMAGGSGTRFWPASREAKPKQLLDLAGSKTMIQATAARLSGAVPPERILVLTNERQVEPICQQLPELPPESVIGEPCKRDTAPCIGLAAMHVSRNDDDATMLVLPADHVIEPDEAFRQAVAQAVELVDRKPTRIVTFGIRPTYPAESYGYIERGEPIAAAAFKVVQFREKPKADVARQYCDSGDFYWNSGIFVWRARTILDSLARYEPEMFARLEAIESAAGSDDFDTVFHREFAAIVGKSIDYAVMERADDVAVIEAPFQWDDLGSWQSLARLRGADEAGNTIAAERHLGLNTTGTIVRSEGNHLIVTVGLTDCIVVHTDGATLVANKHDEESVRDVVKRLKAMGWEEYL